MTGNPEATGPEPPRLTEADYARLEEADLGVTAPAALDIPTDVSQIGGNFFAYFLESQRWRQERPFVQRFTLLFSEEAAETKALVAEWHHRAFQSDYVASSDLEAFYANQIKPKLLFAYQIMAQLVDVQDPGFQEELRATGRPNLYLDH